MICTRLHPGAPIAIKSKYPEAIGNHLVQRLPIPICDLFIMANWWMSEVGKENIDPINARFYCSIKMSFFVAPTPGHRFLKLNPALDNSLHICNSSQPWPECQSPVREYLFYQEVRQSIIFSLFGEKETPGACSPSAKCCIDQIWFFIFIFKLPSWWILIIEWMFPFAQRFLIPFAK